MNDGTQHQRVVNYLMASRAAAALIIIISSVNIHVWRSEPFSTIGNFFFGPFQNINTTPVQSS